MGERCGASALKTRGIFAVVAWRRSVCGVDQESEPEARRAGQRTGRGPALRAEAHPAQGDRCLGSSGLRTAQQIFFKNVKFRFVCESF